MRKAVKLYALLGVLLVICIAAFAVSRYEEKKEQIKNSGEVILDIPTDSVTALSWTNDSGTFSFTKDETWVYDDDNAFPVDGEKIRDLLEQFASFAAAFVIEDVEDYSPYGLDEPVCTIRITAGEESHTVELGGFSKMDEQRYVSIGDGRAYLVSHDPLDEFDAVLRDMILDDTIPEFDTAEQIEFSGGENYTIIRDEDGKSICADDIYFTDGQPLDTDNVDTVLSAIQSLSLTNYVSYNVTDEELTTFGLNDPDLTIGLEYSTGDDDGNSKDSGTLLLRISRDPEEAAAYEEAVENGEEELPDVACYVRVGESQIVYRISQSMYDRLTAVSCDTLRHQKLFTADFDAVTSIDVALSGENYTFTHNPPKDKDDEDAEGTWTYHGEEFDVNDLEHVDPVQYITIIPRGQAGGFTLFRPQDDKSFRSRSEMFENIVVALGGRIAEKIFLDDISTGASGDIQQATHIVRNMVTVYGMSDRLGPISFDSSGHSIFIGRDFGQTKSYSEETAAVIDEEVKRIFDEASAKCEELLRAHADVLVALAEYLLINETIDGEDFRYFCEHKCMPPTPEKSAAAAEQKEEEPSKDAPAETEEAKEE